MSVFCILTQLFSLFLGTCPPSHPYPYNHHLSCCKSQFRGEGCRDEKPDTTLLLKDSAPCCKDGKECHKGMPESKCDKYPDTKCKWGNFINFEGLVERCYGVVYKMILYPSAKSCTYTFLPGGGWGPYFSQHKSFFTLFLLSFNVNFFSSLICIYF